MSTLWRQRIQRALHCDDFAFGFVLRPIMPNLNDLPETLDETYERILKGINKAQKDDAHRLLQCLAVAAVSDRFVLKRKNISHHRVLHGHMEMFQGFVLISMRRIRSWRRRAWFGWTSTLEIVVATGFLTLLNTQFENVSSRVQDGMEELFDTTKPQFSTWFRVHDMGHERWTWFSPDRGHHASSSLYYAALCGLFNLAERLIMMHPEQVNAVGGRIVAPLLSASYKRHFHVADSLHKHGAVVGVPGNTVITPLFCASLFEDVDLVRWLLNHGTTTNALGGGVRSAVDLRYYQK